LPGVLGIGAILTVAPDKVMCENRTQGKVKKGSSMAKKEGLFERINRSTEERTAADQRDRERARNRPAKGVFKRVEQAQEESGKPLYRRDTSNLSTRDGSRGVKHTLPDAPGWSPND
jgi:hypothetical protein